jgi:hypothetical protein
MRVSAWRRIETRGGPVEFFTLELASGLIFRDVTRHQRPDGSYWIALPAKPAIGRDGQQLTAPKTGKPSWVNIIDFRSRTVRDRFQEQVLAALDAFFAGGRR